MKIKKLQILSYSEYYFGTKDENGLCTLHTKSLRLSYFSYLYKKLKCNAWIVVIITNSRISEIKDTEIILRLEKCSSWGAIKLRQGQVHL